jgi:hypothetical protein
MHALVIDSNVLLLHEHAPSLLLIDLCSRIFFLLSASAFSCLNFSSAKLSKLSALALSKSSSYCLSVGGTFGAAKWAISAERVKFTDVRIRIKLALLTLVCLKTTRVPCNCSSSVYMQRTSKMVSLDSRLCHRCGRLERTWLTHPAHQFQDPQTNHELAALGR